MVSLRLLLNNKPMEIYLVGGAVRDALLDYPVTERDWVVVGANAAELLQQGFRQVGKDFPVYLHPQTHEQYALARTERKSGPGHTGFDCRSDPSVTLEQDLRRRDLTINAMAQADDGRIIDPCGGRQDLAGRSLRHISGAFTEDPLRVLRVARFAARYHHLGFAIEPSTLALMRDIVASGELEQLPAERIWQEMAQALGERSPAIFFDSLSAAGALQVLLPELAHAPPPWHRLTALGARPAARDRQRAAQLFAALFEDIEQPALIRLCRRLRVPTQFRELALLYRQLHAAYPRAGAAGGAEILALLENAGAWRQGNRFQQFLQLCALRYPDAGEAARRLSDARQQCLTIDTKQLRHASLQGEAIGARLRELRLERLTAEYG